MKMPEIPTVVVAFETIPKGLKTDNQMKNQSRSDHSNVKIHKNTYKSLEN